MNAICTLSSGQRDKEMACHWHAASLIRLAPVLMSSVRRQLVLKLQEFLVNTFAAHDLSFFAKQVNCLMRKKSVDGKPVLQAFEIRKRSLKNQIFTLINQQPSTTRMYLAFIHLKRRNQLGHKGVSLWICVKTSSRILACVYKNTI
jgi:hypothetical protein